MQGGTFSGLLSRLLHLQQLELLLPVWPAQELPFRQDVLLPLLLLPLLQPREVLVAPGLVRPTLRLYSSPHQVSPLTRLVMGNLSTDHD